VLLDLSRRGILRAGGDDAPGGDHRGFLTRDAIFVKAESGQSGDCLDTRKILFTVAGGLVVLVAAYWGWRLLKPAPKKATPQQLAETALNPSAPPEKRQEAAAELAQFSPREAPAAPQEMTRVYHESREPEVKAVVIQGMASNWDYDSIDTLFAAMDDESLLVRARAHAAVVHLLEVDAGYRADAPREERLAKIKMYRDDWAKYKHSPALRKFREKIKQENAAGGGG
jgi:hypothetical protein